MSQAQTSDPPPSLTPKERSARARVAIETRWTNQRRLRLIDAKIEFHQARLESLRAQRAGDNDGPEAA